MLEAYFLGQLKNLHKKAVNMFSTNLQNALRMEGSEFAVVVAASKKEVLDYFLQGAKAIKLEETEWTYDEELYQLEHGLQEFAIAQREKELNKMLTTLEKHLRKELDEPVGLALNNPGPAMWGRIITIYQRTVEDGEVLLEKKARTFDLDENEQAELLVNLRRQAWVLLTKKIQEESVDGMMLLKLRNRFEEKFRYDDLGLPRVWKPDDDIDTPFRKARDETVNLVPLFAKINTLDPARGEKFELEATEDFDFDQSLKVLSETRQQELTTKFKRESDAFYLEAKRSVVATQAKVPYWVGVALIILGWNEFMTIITSPFYLMVVVMVGVPMGAMWYLDMLGLVESIAWKVYDQVYKFGLEKLREGMEKSRELQNHTQPQQLQQGHRQPQQHSSDSLQNRFSSSHSGKEEAEIEMSSLDKKSQ